MTERMGRELVAEALEILRTHGSPWLEDVRRVRFLAVERKGFSALELFIGPEEMPIRLRAAGKTRMDALLRKGEGAELVEKIAERLFKDRKWDRYTHPSGRHSEWFLKGR